MAIPFAKTAIIVVAASVLAAGTSFAQSATQGERKELVREGVQDINKRITQERQDGNLTHKEAREFRQENREIAQDARQQAKDGNGLSHGEVRDINQQQKSLNRQISREANQ